MGRNKFYSAAGTVAAILVLFVILSGCAPKSKVFIAPYERFGKTKRTVPTLVQTQKMGYSIQVGAFSRVDNAARLTQKLERQGFDAFYFAHSSGLYKVRFGNFPTQGKALEEARRLLQLGIIDVVYIVKPGEYAIARGKPSTEGAIREEIVDTAQTFIGLPYQWGGCSKDALDCSGLVMAVYQLNGLNVPRTSEDQYKSGRSVMKDELEKGDLVFFSTTNSGRVSHVGIYIGNDKFIHAPGRGKTICSENLSTSYYRDRFYGACSYLR